MGDGAVRAVPRTDVSEHHESRGAVFPALADVGAVSLFADGVEIEVPHQLFQPKVVGTPGSTNLQPPRLTLGERFYTVAAGYLVKRLAHDPRGEVMVGKALLRAHQRR